jgi:nucleotide sugar dehydrogenase
MPEASGSAKPGESKVAVIGQGYVGLPLAIRAVNAGYAVVGLDQDDRRVKQLQGAVSYVADVSPEQLAAALDSGRYLPSADYAAAAGFDVCVIAVPTPLSDGVPDLSFITGAAQSIAPHLARGATVILESTTYPGTTEELLGPLLEKGSGLRAGADFCLGYSPERIDPGNPHWRLENTPKVVAGVDARSLAMVEGFYQSLVQRTVPVSSVRTAELTKLLENTYRHVNVALVNELAMFAAELGTDIWEAIDAAATKPFGFQRFTPGPGVGGHCLPIDPTYLSWQVKRQLRSSFRSVELANDINDHMPDYIVSRVSRGLNDRRKPVNGSRILVLGLAYKKNVGDVRESPAIKVAFGLHNSGAEIAAVEPHADPLSVPSGISLVELTGQELARADAVVVLTDHDVLDYALVERCAEYVFDARRRCRGARVEHL